MASYPYTWHWRTKHGERRRQRCRVWARGSMNSIGVEFEDGFRTVTGRFAVRKASGASAPRGLAGRPLRGELAWGDKRPGARLRWPRAEVINRLGPAPLM